MPFLLERVVFSFFLIAALVINSEEKDLEGDTFAVTQRKWNEHGGTFHNHGDHLIEADGNVKRYLNETAAVLKHGKTNGIQYRSKRLRKPKTVEDIGISEYYRQRRHGIAYNYDFANVRPNRGNGGRRMSNNKRGKRFGINFKEGCQTCGNLMGQSGGKRSSNFVRVINGRVVQPAFKFPWIVSIGNPQSGIFCGGAIISATYILTAAHCLLSIERQAIKICAPKSGTMPKICYYKPNEITVNLLGSQPDEKSQWPVKIAKVINHPKFNLKKALHDIGLIKLVSPLYCNQFSSPICLPGSDLRKIGQSLIVAGGGVNSEEGQKGPILLREGTMKQVRPRVCKRSHKKFFNNLNDVICCIGTDNKQSSCKGDSGSSMFAKFKNKFYTIGVTSRHTTKNCQTNKPVVFAKTFRYIKFIKYHVKDLPKSEAELIS